MRLKGQHFLVDRSVIDRIVGYADISKDDEVLEIGPGTGNLTAALAQRAGRVYSLEADPDLALDLEGRYGNVDVIRCNAVTAPLPKCNKVVSNLPYQISTPITFRLLRHHFSIAVLMYQKEFSQRLFASPGHRLYGRLAAYAGYYCHGTVLEYVSQRAFSPQPHVSSAVVGLWPNEKRAVVDEDLFYRLTRDLFTMRRKRLSRALSMLGFDDGAIKMIDPELLLRRPEELSSSDLVRVVNALSSL